MFFLSIRYLYQFTELTGQLLGGIAIASGTLGYVGSARKSANIVNAQLIASFVGILLAFQFVGEVSRDRQVDCALAELYHRGKATERAVASARQAEAMHSVFGRLSEMEDMLTLVQQGAAHNVQLKQEQQALKWTDLNYIKAKVRGRQGRARFSRPAFSEPRAPGLTCPTGALPAARCRWRWCAPTPRRSPTRCLRTPTSPPRASPR